MQVARLVGGVATVADHADLDATAVRPLLEVIADGMLVCGPSLPTAPLSAAHAGSVPGRARR